ncbi:MAG: O-succinylbenzoic acid--CoA ligase, partial [Bacteroidota bacterium]
DTPVVTNDLVKIENTDSFTWLGRFDNVINSGGIKLFPEQIEKKLSQILDFRFFVAGVPDSVLGHKLVLIVEEKSFDLSLLLEKIKHSGLLNKYEIPKGVIAVEKFIQTRTDKFDRGKTLDFIKSSLP